MHSSPGFSSAINASSSAPDVPDVMKETGPSCPGVFTVFASHPRSVRSHAFTLSSSDGSPCVSVYPLVSFSIAFIAAFLIALGTGKSGCPIDRLIGSLSVDASAKMRRIPDASMALARSETSELRSMPSIWVITSSLR